MSNSAMTSDQVVTTLNSLIEMNRDGQKGYQEAAEKIESPKNVLLIPQSFGDLMEGNQTIVLQFLD